jgi:hypothetical protein
VGACLLDRRVKGENGKWKTAKKKETKRCKVNKQWSAEKKEGKEESKPF